MAEKKIICDTEVMIDYWDETNVRHKETKLILENDIGLDNVVLTAINTSPNKTASERRQPKGIS